MKKRGEPFPGEETPDAQRVRVVEALTRRLHERAETDTEVPDLFVAHGGTIRRVLEELGFAGQNKDKRVEVGNAQVFQFVPVGEHDWQVFKWWRVGEQLKKEEIKPPTQAVEQPVSIAL